MLPVYYNPTNRKSTMVTTNDIGAEVARLLTGPMWSGHRVVELGSMVSADEVAAQLGNVMQREVQAFAVPRAEWPAAFEQFGIPKGQTGPAEAMFEAINAGWMDLGVAGTEHVAGTTLPRDVFAAAQRLPRRRSSDQRSGANFGTSFGIRISFGECAATGYLLRAQVLLGALSEMVGGMSKIPGAKSLHWLLQCSSSWDRSATCLPLALSTRNISGGDTRHGFIW
jgi:hypothetical protein